MENPLSGMMEWFSGLPSYAQIGIPVAGAAGIFLIAKKGGSGGGASGAYVNGPYGSSAGGGGIDTSLPAPTPAPAPDPSPVPGGGGISGGGSNNPGGTGQPSPTGSPLPGRRPISHPLPPVYPHRLPPVYPGEQLSPSRTGSIRPTTYRDNNPVYQDRASGGPVDSPAFSDTPFASAQQYYHGNTSARTTGAPTPQHFHGNTTAPAAATPQYFHGNSTAPKTPVKQYFHGNVTAPKTTIATQASAQYFHGNTTAPKVSAPITHPIVAARKLNNTAATSIHTQTKHATLQAAKPVATRTASAAKTYFNQRIAV